MANPLDLLKDKSNTWENIASAYFSEGKRNRKKALLAAGFLGWMGGREQRMIRDTNLKLAELATALFPVNFFGVDTTRNGFHLSVYHSGFCKFCFEIYFS